MPSPAVYRSPRTSAVAATVLLAVSGAEALASLGTAFRLYGQVGDIAEDTELVDQSSLMDTAHLYDSISVLQLVTLIATAAAFVTWFHRVRVNAEAFDPHGHRFRRGWAIGGWVTPVVALWFPRQIAGDIWQASTRPDASGVRLPAPQILINLWWAAFLLSNALDRLGSRFLNSARYPDSYQQAVGWLIAAAVTEVAGAVLAVLLVRRLTAMQEELFAEAAGRAFGAQGTAVRG
ncbi:DUF4328 domain-containing protein [Kitasatospora sp. NPDC036755]|uniref:DUF4328 domain-containing protein n=1 Tax=Kitasatospora sp. NPDC036755 TaxID=3154600 RepID=UPI0033D6FC7D